MIFQLQRHREEHLSGNLQSFTSKEGNSPSAIVPFDMRSEQVLVGEYDLPHFIKQITQCIQSPHDPAALSQ